MEEFMMGKRIGRRAVLRSCALLLLPMSSSLSPAAARSQAQAGVNDTAALNNTGNMVTGEITGFPISQLDGFTTPNNQFYVRNHFAVPKLTKSTWRLKVEGAVRHPLELTYDQLLSLKASSQPVTLECAGNSSPMLFPQVDGLPAESYMASNAEWTGVPLAYILERAGLRPTAKEVMLEGADAGEIGDSRSPAGIIHYSRSLPIAKARQDVLLAYSMNGADLPAEHGYPVRAIVPGWYGMASVKWLTRINVVEEPFRGYYQEINYAYWQTHDGLASRVPITELEVKSAIARPKMNEVVARDADYRIFGAAWTGDSHVAKVEVSVDTGRTWSPAKLLGESIKNTWRLWEFHWRTPANAGRCTIMCRATDLRGRIQPFVYDPDRGGYMVSHVLPVHVEVQ